MVYLKGKKKLFLHPVLKQICSTESEIPLWNYQTVLLQDSDIILLIFVCLSSHYDIRLIITTLQLPSPENPGRPRCGWTLLTRVPDCPQGLLKCFNIKNACITCRTEHIFIDSAWNSYCFAKKIFLLLLQIISPCQDHPCASDLSQVLGGVRQGMKGLMDTHHLLNADAPATGGAVPVGKYCP